MNGDEAASPLEETVARALAAQWFKGLPRHRWEELSHRNRVYWIQMAKVAITTVREQETEQ